MDKPTYEHTCDSCRFIKNIAYKSNKTGKLELADVYICGRTVLVRFSSNDSDYASADIYDLLYAAVSNKSSVLFTTLAGLFNDDKIKIDINITINDNLKHDTDSSN